MIGVLGVSKKDVHLAALWLKWVSFLCTRKGGASKDERLIVMLTQNMGAEGLRTLQDAVKRSRGMFAVEFWILGDENEAGYPISASHLFLRSLEHCESHHPGEPVLWIEADAVPVRPGWFQRIAEEYRTCGQPFMGHVEAGHYTPHLAGVAVYPPDWRKRSPRLAGVLQAPDVRAWGPGKGQAFDMYAGPELVKQAAHSETIQQVWQCPPMTVETLDRINPTACLFHQCKTGTLIRVLAMERFRQRVA